MKSKFSEIQIIPIKPKDGLVGFASVIFDNSFYLGSIGIYTRPSGGYRLTYPKKQYGTQHVMNVFFPINSLIGKELEEIITNKFDELMSNSVRQYEE